MSYSAVVVALAIAMALNGCSDRPEPVSDGHAASATQPSSGLNVYLFVLDTLRPDYLELDGFYRNTAPFLANLAETSVVFDQAFSTSSWTGPATASLLTSLYPPQHGFQINFLYQRIARSFKLRDTVEPMSPTDAERKNIIEVHDRGPVVFHRLRDDVSTLPEILRPNGYATIAMSGNVNIQPQLNFDQGFETFRYTENATADEFYAQFSQWNNDLAGRAPYLLYGQFMDPHVPYHVRDPYYVDGGSKDANRRERYLSEIRYLDDYLKKIYDLFGMDENSLLIIVSDHGSINHGPSLYRELNRVLMIFHSPALGLRPSRVAANVSLIDVLPTVLDLLSLPKPDQAMEGVSLAPILLGTHEMPGLKDRLAQRTLFAHRVRPYFPDPTEIWAAIHGDRKLILDEHDGEPPKLFDIANDFAERNDLADAEPEVVAGLSRSLTAFRNAPRYDLDAGI